MTDTILYFLHYSLTLISGVVLSAGFAGVPFSKKNIGILCCLCLFSGAAQVIALFLLGEDLVWKLYPLLVHLPLSLLLRSVFRKRPIPMIASVTLAYLCCQPARWFGLLAEALSSNVTIAWIVKIAVCVTVSMVIFIYFSHHIAEIFNKDDRSVVIFGCVPFTYYLFDYFVSIYTDIWITYYRLTAEFLALFLCIVYMAFCLIYYREHERKMLIQYRNQITETTVLQQAKEIEAIQESTKKIRLLRHDMRLLLSNLAVSIEQGDKQTALNLISGYTDQVDTTSVHRYCTNDTVNYILTNFESRCKNAQVEFAVDLKMDELPVDEVLFSSIISNALDNALNAQKKLPAQQRKIRLMLKVSNGKLLLSVKNPFAEAPVFADDVPISKRNGHGYGTQSILYLTEKMGGKCQFSVENNTFILRIVL